jgi:hypothetical protein
MQINDCKDLLGSLLEQAKKYKESKLETLNLKYRIACNDVLYKKCKDEDLILKLIKTHHGISYSESNFEKWRNQSWFARHFTNPPVDDRTSHRKKIEEEHIEKVVDETRKLIDKNPTIESLYHKLYIYYASGHYSYSLRISPIDDTIGLILLRESAAELIEQYSRLNGLIDETEKLEGVLNNLETYEYDTAQLQQNVLNSIYYLQEAMNK